MVMSSAYVVRFTRTCGVDMSDVYILNNVGDRTPPCGILLLNLHYNTVLFLNIMYSLRPLM